MHILDLYTHRALKRAFRRKLQYDFPKMRGGRRPFGIFPNIHPFWYRHPSLVALQSPEDLGRPPMKKYELRRTETETKKDKNMKRQYTTQDSKRFQTKSNELR